MSRSPLLLTTFALLLTAAPFSAALAAPPIELNVDARESPRHVLHVAEVLSVRPGTLSLAYPKWIPGEHGPTGPISEVVDLVVHAGGQQLEWRRDDVDMYVVRVIVPAGATKLELSFDFLLTDNTAGYSTASSASEQLLIFNWNQVLFYPAGVPSDQVDVHATLAVPAGWAHGTPLAIASARGDVLDFTPCTLTRLVDSPVLLGRYFRTLDISPRHGPPYLIDMACDGPDGLKFPDSALVAYRRLPAEAQAWFGGWHHGPYHFLVTLSDYTSHFGLEHHESSDDRVMERTFVEDNLRLGASNLLSHELAHSWNGKYRRPAGLATPDYGTPMKGELLWVYEGLTQYSGWLLAGRSGIRTYKQSLSELARITAMLENHRGREWRPLLDTAVEAQVLYDARDAWQDERRGTDFYNEGLLLWLETDVTIRELTHGSRSLDDFCHAFHGGQGGVELRPYTFADVVAALDGVVHHDWAAFLHERVDRVQPHPPLAGIERGGWQRAWSDTMSDVLKAAEARSGGCDESCSIGIEVAKDGTIKDVVPGSAAFAAGVVPGNTLVAVNGRRWTNDILRDAIRATRTGTPLELLVTNRDFFHTARLSYTGGLRYPVLERAAGKPDVLAGILAPHAND